MKIFIIHYKKLIDRKAYIQEQFKKFNITDYEFIEIDRDELYKENISMFQENYNNSQIAISLSHFYAYKQISDNYDNGLIFEDDVILSNDFVNIFNNYISQLPQDYDMLFIGDGCNFHIPNHKLIPNKNIYQVYDDGSTECTYGYTRCTDSYLVNKKCAEKICHYITNLSYKIDLPIDHWLNIVSRDNDFKVYWAEPTIATQGTQNGLFNTSH
jgi:GR25 family glycosyltransferase involved in LPS biosynthesis